MLKTQVWNIGQTILAKLSKRPADCTCNLCKAGDIYKCVECGKHRSYCTNSDDEFTDPCYYCWEKKNDYSIAPEDRHWFIVNGREWASDGVVLISRDCPPINGGPTRGPWVMLGTPHQDEAIANLFNADAPLNYHKGWFRDDFSVLKSLEGLVVLGEHAESPAYCLVGGDLIAIIMPVRIQLACDRGYDLSCFFQF